MVFFQPTGCSKYTRLVMASVVTWVFLWLFMQVQVICSRAQTLGHQLLHPARSQGNPGLHWSGTRLACWPSSPQRFITYGSQLQMQSLLPWGRLAATTHSVMVQASKLSAKKPLTGIANRKKLPSAKPAIAAFSVDDSDDDA